MLHLDALHLHQTGFDLRANWSADAGQIVAVIGPSGAGKSSLLMAVAGFLAPAAGRLRWAGQDITALPPARRPVSILFQDQNLFPHLSIADNLGLALAPDLRLTAPQRTLVAQTLARLGLGEMAQRRPAALSGGQLGRAALGRVLLQARPILLLDEPFAALGPALKSDLLALVAQITAQTGALTLLVTHDPSDARRFAAQTVLVADGVAHPPRPTAALFADPPAALLSYLGT